MYGLGSLLTTFLGLGMKKKYAFHLEYPFILSICPLILSDAFTEQSWALLLHPSNYHPCRNQSYLLSSPLYLDLHTYIISPHTAPDWLRIQLIPLVCFQDLNITPYLSSMISPSLSLALALAPSPFLPLSPFFAHSLTPPRSSLFPILTLFSLPIFFSPSLHLPSLSSNLILFLYLHLLPGANIEGLHIPMEQMGTDPLPNNNKVRSLESSYLEIQYNREEKRTSCVHSDVREGAVSHYWTVDEIANRRWIDVSFILLSVQSPLTFLLYPLRTLFPDCSQAAGGRIGTGPWIGVHC